MAITPRQFDQLSEMGISLWQSRSQLSTEQTTAETYLAHNQQSLALLIKQQLFSDILLCLNLSVGEVEAKNDHLDVGLFNWYFSNNNVAQHEPSTQKPLIYYIENKLFSPSIDTISQSSTLKKQLWQTLAKHLAS